jgi:hypothetical protein
LAHQRRVGLHDLRQCENHSRRIGRQELRQRRPKEISGCFPEASLTPSRDSVPMDASSSSSLTTEPSTNLKPFSSPTGFTTRRKRCWQRTSMCPHQPSTRFLPRSCSSFKPICRGLLDEEQRQGAEGSAETDEKFVFRPGSMKPTKGYRGGRGQDRRSQELSRNEYRRGYRESKARRSSRAPLASPLR